MAGQVAFDIVFDKKTKVVEKAKVATGIGHSCQLAWNPTLEEVKEEFMETISPEEKKSMSIWESSWLWKTKMDLLLWRPVLWHFWTSM